MNQKSIQIAQLIKENGLTGKYHGLMYGTTGLCILFYHLTQFENNSEYKNLADDLLDKVFANLNTSSVVNFEHGLVGIGWGIEYLIQNGFVEGDSDDILEVIDNKVFKVLNEEPITAFELGNGLTGHLLYLTRRWGASSTKCSPTLNRRPSTWRFSSRWSPALTSSWSSLSVATEGSGTK